MAFYKKIYSQKMGVYYPLAVTMGSPVSTKIIAERLAQISTVSLADVAAVLAELPGVMADYMAQGKSVRLEDLGIFRYKLSTILIITHRASLSIFATIIMDCRVRFLRPLRHRGHDRAR